MGSRPRETESPSGPANGAAPPPPAAGDVEITKPRNDKRGYRRVVLPNALECLLISDPDTDKVCFFDRPGMGLDRGSAMGFGF